MSTRINTVDGLSALLAQQKQAFVAAGEVTAAERRDRIQQVIDMLVVSHKTLVEAIDAERFVALCCEYDKVVSWF